jgi:hemolysin activation/secretion protein
VIWRNEVQLPAIALRTGGTARLRPRLFADLGSGRDRATGITTTMTGVGFGADLNAGPVTAQVVVGQALRSAGETKAHHWTIIARLTAQF